MELNYIKCGDYYIPDIGLQKPNIRLGHYGMLRKAYLALHSTHIWCCPKRSTSIAPKSSKPQEAALT